MNNWLPEGVIIWPEPITEPSIPMAKSNGYVCDRCDEYVPMSEPNQPDGTFVCFGCRKRI